MTSFLLPPTFIPGVVGAEREGERKRVGERAREREREGERERAGSGAARDDELPLAAHLHARDALVPPLDHLVQGLGFRVQGSGFRAQGSGFRVQGWCTRSPAPNP